jgi:predicted RNA binding protein YcfA (HicA-like mRNA interferase family)
MAGMKAVDLLRRLRHLATKRDWEISERSARGAHVILRLNARITVVPVHSGDLPQGTYRKILKDLGLTNEDMKV